MNKECPGRFRPSVRTARRENVDLARRTNRRTLAALAEDSDPIRTIANEPAAFALVQRQRQRRSARNAYRFRGVRVNRDNSRARVVDRDKKATLERGRGCERDGKRVRRAVDDPIFVLGDDRIIRRFRQSVDRYRNIVRAIANEQLERVGRPEWFAGSADRKPGFRTAANLNRGYAHYQVPPSIVPESPEKLPLVKMPPVKTSPACVVDWPTSKTPAEAVRIANFMP